MRSFPDVRVYKNLTYRVFNRRVRKKDDLPSISLPCHLLGWYFQWVEATDRVDDVRFHFRVGFRFDETYD